MQTTNTTAPTTLREVANANLRRYRLTPQEFDQVADDMADNGMEWIRRNFPPVEVWDTELDTLTPEQVTAAVRAEIEWCMKPLEERRDDFIQTVWPYRRPNEAEYKFFGRTAYADVMQENC